VAVKPNSINQSINQSITAVSNMEVTGSLHLLAILGIFKWVNPFVQILAGFHLVQLFSLSACTINLMTGHKKV
jgi:hypothetical protein